MTFDQILEQLITLLYQRGLPPQATYTFKHALIQDAAYESLLKSTRQQYHQRIAQVLEELFAETVELFTCGHSPKPAYAISDGTHHAFLPRVWQSTARTFGPTFCNSNR